MEDYKFNFVKENGEEVECEKILSFHSDKTNKYYLLFTDNKQNEQDELNIYTYYMIPNDDTLYPVTEEKEFAMVKEIYDKIRGDL